MIEKYANFFEQIDENTSIEEFKKIFHKDVYFKDPFHEFNGIEKLFKVFENMYKQLENPKFKVIETVENQNSAYIKWVFTYKFKNSSTLQVFEGLSQIYINEENKVISHVDYWDAGANVYEKIPILSTLIKFVKRKIRG